MNKKIALALALALAPFAASAEGLSYTYVEGGYAKLHVDASELGNPEGDGPFLRGSYDIGSGVNVFGRAARVSQDFDLGAGDRLDVDLTGYELGLGYHQALSERVDFVSELAYVRVDADADLTGFGSESGSAKGGRVAIGARGLMADRVEGWVKANYYDGGDFEGGFTGVLGVQVKFNPTWGVVGEIEHGEMLSNGDTLYTLGVRASF